VTAIAKRIVRAAVAVGATATLVAVPLTGTAAAATPRNGVCEVGEFCLYYFSNLTGSVSDFTTSIPNYGTTQPTCYDFKGPGDGQDQCIKNNARSVWNRRPGAARVYFNSNYGGAFDNVAGNSWRNLVVTYDQNASHTVS
jgi:hypothetical protein